MSIRQSKTLRIKRSEFAQATLWLAGQPFSLADYPHLIELYDCEAREQVLQFSRQTAKSTTLAAMTVSNCCMMPDFKSLFIAPTVDQSKVFSHDRVNPFLNSPLIRANYINSSVTQNVFMKELTNRAKIYIRYALLDADKIRGYSADQNLFDECQDLLSDIIPVVQETMSRSELKWTTYSGTPKRTRGTLADIWHRSSMNEYAIKCTACNHWNILDEDNIGPAGVICSKCGADMDVRQKAEWVSTHSLTQKPDLEGFRVCALHFAKAPWVEWERDILGKRKVYSKAKFLNEVLAIEHDAGVTPVSEADIRRVAVGPNYHHEPTETDRSYTSIMGIDYGPVNSENSHTVISIVQPRGHGLEVVYAKKFVGKEADYAFIHEEIPRLMKKWGCAQLAADYGMGEAPNSEIRSRIGYSKVIAFQNLGTQKEEIRWNNKMPAYTLSKTKALNRFFQNIKRGKITFPEYNSFIEFIDDIYNIQIESDESLGNVKYINIGPDDFVYATLFASIAATLYFKIDWQD